MAADPYSSPLAYFSAKLKRLRERAGMTQGDVAEQTNYALSTVSAYETGTRIPSADFAKLADKVFGTGPESEADEGELEGLQKLVETVSVRPWFRDRVEVERKAREIREYESYQIPGLLQTEDYARACASAVRPMLSEDAVERAVALKMSRQEILQLEQELPPELDHGYRMRLWAIMDECALHRVIGNAEVMQKQRDHLVEATLRPNITIQIIPSAEGVTCAFGRAFTILTSDSNSNSSVVYLEDVKDAHYLRDRDHVAEYMLILDHLRSLALDDRRSLKLIKDVEK